MVRNRTAGNHLYRIAQEAAHNAVKHGKAKNLTVRLAAVAGRGILTIRDEGSGINSDTFIQTGMGLNIMKYRAGMIGGALEVTRSGERDALVTRNFPN